MMRNLFIPTVVLLTASLIVPAWAQSAVEANRAAEAYKTCMAAPVADYALRTGTPEQLAKQIARLCADEEAALSAAYVAAFFPDHTKSEAKDLAKLYVDQITAGNLETVRLDITRLRVETENAR